MGVLTFAMLLTILVATLLVTIAVSYTVSVLYGHVPALFPYISETGTLPPESCLFGFGMNIASFMYVTAVYLRYRELLTFHSLRPTCGLSLRANRWAWWLGSSSAFGLCMVANFQVMRVPVPHFLGAFLCFVGGSVYFGIQARLSARICPALSSPRVVRLRVLLTALSAVALVVCMAAAVVAIPQFDGDPNNQMNWLPTNKAYALHVVSTAAEWVVALVFIASIVTYIPEMRQVAILAPEFRITLMEGATITEKL